MNVRQCLKKLGVIGKTLNLFAGYNQFFFFAKNPGIELQSGFLYQKKKIQDRIFMSRSYSLGIKCVFLPLYKKSKKK